MYLHTALRKIQLKHGDKAKAFVEFYSLPNCIILDTKRELRLDQAANQLLEDYYTAYCLTDNREPPLDYKTFRLSEPMNSPTGACTMYRIYQERFDGFHQVGLVTVLNGLEYSNFKWKERKLHENTKRTHGRPWWQWKELN